jgi:hypothetical protein
VAVEVALDRREKSIDIEEEFRLIVEQIDIAISPEELEKLVREPQMKASGTMDQGYRHN